MTMSITGDKSLDESVWWLLQKLKSFISVHGEEAEFTFWDGSFSDDKTTPYFQSQRLVVEYLKQQRAIEGNVHAYSASRDTIPQFILTIQQPKFDEIYKKFSESSKHHNVGEQPKTKVVKDTVVIKLKSGKFAFNLKNGNTTLNKVSATFSPKSLYFNILFKIVNDPNHTVMYKDLLGEKDGKTGRRDLGFYMKDIKMALGILPKEKAKNKDIFKNLKQHGYCLVR